MKTITKFSCAGGLFIAAMVLASSVQYTVKTEPQTKDKVSGPGFALVELFTSEGCSSCPPADELVAKVWQENTGKPVYILAFHVDYWDHQGWKDVFSNPDFTKRQYQYADWLRTETVYTPQIVVNGRQEFVGSQEASLKDAIASGLQASASASLDIDAHREGSKIALQYTAKGAVRNSILQLAVVQKVAQTTVRRGENAGRLLSHVQIVRQIQSQPVEANGAGHMEIAVPDGYDPKDWEVIVFLQNKNQGKVLAVAKPEV